MKSIHNKKLIISPHHPSLSVPKMPYCPACGFVTIPIYEIAEEGCPCRIQFVYRCHNVPQTYADEVIKKYEWSKAVISDKQ